MVERGWRAFPALTDSWERTEAKECRGSKVLTESLVSMAKPVPVVKPGAQDCQVIRAASDRRVSGVYLARRGPQGRGVSMAAWVCQGLREIRDPKDSQVIQERLVSQGS